MFQAKHNLLVQREHSATLFFWASKIMKYSLCYIGSFIEGQIQIKKSHDEIWQTTTPYKSKAPFDIMIIIIVLCDR